MSLDSSLWSQALSIAKSLRQLNGLVKLLSSAVPQLDSTVDQSVPRPLIPKHIYISDCIILSAPLEDPAHASYDGLTIVVMRAIQLSHYLLGAGFLTRGGISIGKTYHTRSNIIGPAYQEAFCLEQTGDEPVVVLSATAAKRWKGQSRMCLQHNGKVFVNGLFDYYIPDNTKFGVVEQTYSAYRALAEKRLAENLPSSARSKWSWFLEFLGTEAPEGLKWAQA